MKALIVFYSAYGHIYKMAQAMADGMREVDGAKVEIKKVQETLTAEVLERTGIAAAQKAFAHIPIATLEDLEKADAIIFGTPTRFGNMCAQMRAFLDSTGRCG
jgi:NAD(P)H dehydrogenase (quinone)